MKSLQLTCSAPWNVASAPASVLSHVRAVVATMLFAPTTAAAAMLAAGLLAGNHCSRKSHPKVGGHTPPSTPVPATYTTSPTASSPNTAENAAVLYVLTTLTSISLTYTRTDTPDRHELSAVADALTRLYTPACDTVNAAIAYLYCEREGREIITDLFLSYLIAKREGQHARQLQR